MMTNSVTKILNQMKMKFERDFSFSSLIRVLIVLFKDINYNKICLDEYSRQTAVVMSQISEKILSFELIEVKTKIFIDLKGNFLFPFSFVFRH